MANFMISLNYFHHARLMLEGHHLDEENLSSDQQTSLEIVCVCENIAFKYYPITQKLKS